ncbi:MAG: endonuclease [Candidatus Berkiella sp.]
MKNRFSGALFLIGLLVSCQVLSAVKNYTEAKNTARFIWQDHRETFYCGCQYDKHGVIDFSSCAFRPKNKRRARYITWEHVVPVSWYGRQLPCWKGQGCESNNHKPLKGRACCRKVDKQFRLMEADLHNLVPEVKDLNQARRNYHFTSNIKYPTQVFRGCEMLVDDQNEEVVVKEQLLGTISRIHLYMAKKYGIVLSPNEHRQFEAWHKQYRPSRWEKEWNQKVAKHQGNLNEFIQ